MKIRFGSVCSGIEAASVAWHPLGWEAAWLSEIEKFPCEVLKHHYPNTLNLGDMTLLADKIQLGEVEAPDVFCGGTPCQAFSVAGLRQSLDDSRGNLSLTFCEIANAIDDRRLIQQSNPAIIFWENVPGVLNTKDNAFGCFLAGLAGESDALIPPGGRWTDAGFIDGPKRAVAWRTLDAQYFGLAQRRKRVFVVASARNDICPAEILFEFESVRRDTSPSRKEGQEIANCLTKSPSSHSSYNPARSEGNAVVVDWPADKASTHAIALAENTIGRQPQNGGNGNGFTEGDPMYTLNATGVHGVAHAYSFDSLASNSMKSSNPISGCNEVELSKTLDTSCLNPTANQGGIAVAHAIAFAPSPFTRGFDMTPTNELSDTLKTEMNGNSPHVAFVDVYNLAVDGEVSATLTEACGGTSSSGPKLMQNMAVRRLTPIECERLQGFPDNYTNIKANCSDGSRYKALGNSWAVPVVAWIGKRINDAIT